MCVLVACSGHVAEQTGSESQPLPAPTPGCAWRYQPLWLLDPGCQVLSGFETEGSVLAPLSAGSDGACELDQLQANPREWTVQDGKPELMLWQPNDETRPPQYAQRPCK